MTELAGEQNPFLRYRERLDSYDAVRTGRLSDDRFVELVEQLDASVASVGGVGFRVTPVIDGAALVPPASSARLSIKVDVGNVAGSHKARHLFGVALHLLVDEAAAGHPVPSRLAIASCGNAALGAATVAKALGRQLDVFVPTWADETVVDALDSLDATVHRCERRTGEIGDPCYLRFREAVAEGAHSFSVQGTDTATTFDGGRTLGWEIEEQVGTPDALYIQVGGGALATAVGRALPGARLHPVQAEGCAPLNQAWKRLAPDFDFAAAAAHPDRYMTAWPNPSSLATGILDDVTYDWLPLLRQTHATGGWPIVVPETVIEAAWTAARDRTDVAVCTTGTAGLAGLFSDPPIDADHAVVIFTGIDRT
ncbi:MAG: PLP-dependent lyase/thiolase [Actinomycetota bacterium]